MMNKSYNVQENHWLSGSLEFSCIFQRSIPYMMQTTTFYYRDAIKLFC